MTFFRAATFLIALAFAQPGRAEQPSVGDIFDINPGESFRGWYLNESGIGEDEQPYSVFDRDGQEIIAVTSPVVRNATGGIIVKKITKIVFVTRGPSEERLDGHDCGFLGLSPAIALFDKKTKIARGYFVMRDDVWVRRWIVDERELCEYGGD